MKNGRIILAGGRGFLGTHLADLLVSRGYEVFILTRRPSPQGGPIREFHWDGNSAGDWGKLLEGARAVINLSGRSVNCRYTPHHRQEIIESRVNSVRALGEAIGSCSDPPKVLVQAGSLAIYGDTGPSWCDEEAAIGQGFPAETCKLWEKAFDETPTPETRRVFFRISFVLGKEGGALRTLANLARCGLGGRVGDGRQYISWVHIADMNQMFLTAIEQQDIKGVFNATAPNPVTNAEFMRELRQVLHRPWSPPVPKWAVHVGSFFMRTEACLALTGRRCLPRRLVEHGFAFAFPNLRPALNNIYG